MLLHASLTLPLSAQCLLALMSVQCLWITFKGNSTSRTNKQPFTNIKLKAIAQLLKAHGQARPRDAPVPLPRKYPTFSFVCLLLHCLFHRSLLTKLLSNHSKLLPRQLPYYILHPETSFPPNLHIKLPKVGV